MKQIVESANGVISVHSEGKREGSEFIVNLPMRAIQDQNESSCLLSVQRRLEMSSSYEDYELERG